jgi:hypothetical protein
MVDFQFENHGSIILCTPQNEGAKEHLIENLGDEAQWLGDSVAVEPRYILDLVEGLRSNGYVCEG